MMPLHPANFTDAMREAYVRLVLPDETRIPVQTFKAIINPSFNDETVVLLHLRSMSVCIMPRFTENGAVISLTTNDQPSQGDMAKIARLDIEPGWIAHCMHLAYCWRQVIEDNEGPGFTDFYNEVGELFQHVQRAVHDGNTDMVWSARYFADEQQFDRQLQFMQEQQQHL